MKSDIAPNYSRSTVSKRPLANLQALIKQKRILVVGDVMLDRYWFGDVSRISPEAPVPVVKIGRSEERLGGAANVALNLVALGAKVDLLSVIGKDEAGGTLEKLMKDCAINARLHRDPGISTTVKLRVIGRHQQLLRIDFETAPSREILSSKLKDYERMLARADLVILSDYGKGGLTHIAKMISLARKMKKSVLVDPKGDDYARYKGATMLTPNRGEFRQVAGGWKNEKQLTQKAQKLRATLGLDALLITRSEEGMTLYRREQRMHQATQAQEVFDVSGAGDTVIATLGAVLAGGADFAQAVRFANKAAGIVVAKLGTAVVQPEELFN